MAKSVDVFTEITINKDIRSVADYASNPDHAPEWYDNIHSVEWETHSPLVLGSKIRFKARFLGRELIYTYQISEWIPEQKLVMETAQGPFPMKTIYTWESLGDSQTRMTLRNTGKPSGFSAFLAPLMVRAMRKANAKDLIQLKKILEG